MTLQQKTEMLHPLTNVICSNNKFATDNKMSSIHYAHANERMSIFTRNIKMKKKHLTLQGKSRQLN